METATGELLAGMKRQGREQQNRNSSALATEITTHFPSLVATETLFHHFPQHEKKENLQFRRHSVTRSVIFFK